MLRPVGIMVVNGNCSVSLCQSFQLLLDQIGLGSAQPDNNCLTDRNRAAARYLTTTGLPYR